MLYVIEYCYLNDFEDDNSGISRVLKVGYSNDFDHRYQQYCICSNKNFKVLYKIEGGTIKDEQNLHRYLRKTFNPIRELGKEWYEKTDALLEFFDRNVTIEDIRKVSMSYSKYLKVSNLFIRSIEEVIEIDKDLKIVPRILNENILESDENIELIKDRIIYFYDENTFQSIINIYKSKVNLYNKNKEEISEFLSVFNNLSHFRLKLKHLCETKISNETRSIVLEIIPNCFKRFYLVLGPEKCQSLGYGYSYLKKYLDDYDTLQKNGDSLTERVYERIKENTDWFKKDLKQTLQEIYQSFGLNKKAKAIDIKEWFEVKEQKLIMEDGNRISGFKLIKRLK